MIIIEKSSCIMHYSVNPTYFDKFSTVYCDFSAGNYWRTSESNSYTFKYDFHFHAKDEQSGESFIEYKSRMACMVYIENEKEDAPKMLAVVKEFYESMNLFIKNNSLSHFSKLDLPRYVPTKMELIKMEEGIARVKEKMPHHEKTELQKQQEKNLENLKIEVKIIQNRTVID